MMIQEAMEKIEAQQMGKERTAPWMVGEQLKDILRSEPRLAELVAQDLETEGLSLVKCEAEIKKYADGHKTGSFACVTPAEAERIIRKFYGLPARGEAAASTDKGAMINFMDFL